jgi:hypothetical protein
MKIKLKDGTLCPGNAGRHGLGADWYKFKIGLVIEVKEIDSRLIEFVDIIEETEASDGDN